MTDYIVRATIIVRGKGTNETRIRTAVDAGLLELSSIASRYGFTVVDSTAIIDEA